MSSSRQAGPVCETSDAAVVLDGTLCQVASPEPGPVCAPPGTIREFIRRVENVKAAFLLGIREYAYPETLAKLGADLQLILDSLWPGFVQALQIYGLSISAGAILFGVAGAVLGEGIGAVPASLLGAKFGAEVATGIMLLMGIRFLAEYVLEHLGAANEHFQRGFHLAWDACGENPPLEAAGREFGRAIAELASLLLQAATAWLLKKGLNKGLSDLNKSEMGRALAPYAKVQYWRQKLGVSDAPVPRRGIATTIEFFEQQVAQKNLKAMDEGQLKSYWKAMDFSKQVSTETLARGKELIAYRDPQSPYGYYYAERGAYLDRLGVDYVTQRALPEGVQGPKQLVDREFIRYRVKRPVDVLKSSSSGVRAHDTKQPVPGGGTQYFIPRAWEFLEIID